MYKQAVVMVVAIILLAGGQLITAKPFHEWAKTPPMGWNSWDI